MTQVANIGIKNLSTISLQSVQNELVIVPDYFYFQDSEFYHIRGGYVAEVIQNPFIKIMYKNLNERKWIGKRTGASCERDEPILFLHLPPGYCTAYADLRRIFRQNAFNP